MCKTKIDMSFVLAPLHIQVKLMVMHHCFCPLKGFKNIFALVCSQA